MREFLFALSLLSIVSRSSFAGEERWEFERVDDVPVQHLGHFAGAVRIESESDAVIVVRWFDDEAYVFNGDQVARALVLFYNGASWRVPIAIYLWSENDLKWELNASRSRFESMDNQNAVAYFAVYPRECSRENCALYEYKLQLLVTGEVIANGKSIGFTENN